MTISNVRVVFLIGLRAAPREAQIGQPSGVPFGITSLWLCRPDPDVRRGRYPPSVARPTRRARVRVLPTGTLTFLFSDIEGSTRLLTALGAAFGPLLERHQAVLRGAFEAAGGVEVATEGDSFFVVFRSATSAVAAAAAVQRALAAEPWAPAADAVRVRMGLHTGEGTLGGDNYVGIDVHRAARIAAAAHGGQIVISATTRALLRHALPPGVSVTDLGEHRLRGIAEPMRLAQVAIDGFPGDFPPPKSEGARGLRLPREPTNFVGRTAELEAVHDLLAESRLVTLVGPGGAGKTRLAIEAARRATDRFVDGAIWIPLVGLTDYGLVAGAIAESLELHLDARQPTASVLQAHLADRQLLLVFDNFERVADAAPLIADLLESSPRISALVTSRTPLHMRGEQLYRVPPLDLPDRSHPITAAAAANSTAVQLFMMRARQVDPDLTLTDANADAIAEICERLDGLPLAIELAAARIDILPVEAIRSRMEDRLTLLASRTRDLDERQRTLRGAIDWSYELLDEPVARVFRRLGVFIGGCTLGAATAQAGKDEPPEATLDALSALLDASLLRREPGEAAPRYRMLETVAEYARERLAQAAEAHAAQSRAAAYWIETVVPLRTGLTAGAPEALAVIEGDYTNILTSLAWALGGSLGRPHGDPADPALGAVLTSAMGSFWALRHVRDGSAWMARALECSTELQAELRAELSFQAGVVFDGGGRDTDAESNLRNALALFQQVGDRTGEARAANSLGVVARGRGDLQEARTRFEQGLSLRRELGMPLSNALNNVAVVATDLGDYESARRVFAQALELDLAANDIEGVATGRSNLAAVALRTGNAAGAAELLALSLPGFIEAGDLIGVAEDFERFAELAMLREEFQRAAVLFGASSALRQEEGIPQPKIDLRQTEGLVADVRARLGEAAFSAAYARGELMSVATASVYALGA